MTRWGLCLDPSWIVKARDRQVDGRWGRWVSHLFRTSPEAAKQGVRELTNKLALRIGQVFEVAIFYKGKRIE